jgi:hypothetical protein
LNAYPKKHQDNHPQPFIKESEISAEPPPPDDFSTPSGATPKDIFSNLPQQDPSSSMPQLDVVPVTFDQSEGDFIPFGASGMAALDPNDWITPSNSNIAFDMNWESAANDWSYDF